MTENKRKTKEDGADTAQNKAKKPKTPKKSKSFDLKLFRKSLKTNDFIFEIKGFLRAASDDPSLVAEYLQSKGTVLELVEALSKIDSSNLSHLASIFDAIQLILLEIASSPEHKPVAMPGLTFLMNNNKSLLLKLLSSDDETHRIAAMKTLTGAVILGISAIQILRVLDSLVADRTLEETIFQSCKITPENLGDNLRKTYIQLILSFLIDAEVVVISQVLQRDYLILALMKGLVHDDLADVALILNTFSGIIERNDITKTQKKRAFPEMTVKAILDVFKWKGQEFLIHKKEKLINEDLRKEAATVAGDFLKLLLTSRKYGIAFDAMGRDRHNVIQMIVIKYLKYFWNDEQSSDLIQNIITACPEQIMTLMDRITFCMAPKLNESWFNCVLFTQNLLETTNVSQILRSIKDLGPKRMTEYILNYSLCTSILQHIDETALLKGQSVEIRDQLLKILLIMLKQCNKFLVELQEMQILDYDLKKIKFNIVNQIFSYFPNVETLLNALHQSIKYSARNSEECRSQLHSTLDIIILLNDLVPSMIKNENNIINYINILKPIYNYQGEENIEAEERLEMNLKVVKIMLLLEPDALNVQNVLFASVFTSLINVFVAKDNQKFMVEAQNLLQKLLLSTEHFDEMIEVNAILLAFLKIRDDPEKIDKTTQFLVNILKKDKLSNINYNVEAQLGIVDFESLFERIEKSDVKEIVTGGSTSLSLFLPNLVKEGAQVVQVKEFLENIALGLFFSIPEKNIITEVFKQIDSPLNKYFSKTYAKNLSQLPAQFETTSAFIESISMTTFTPDLLLPLKTEIELNFYLQIIIFTSIELTKKKQFTAEHRSVCIQYVKSILHQQKMLFDAEVQQIIQLEDKASDLHQENFIVQYIFCQQYQLLEVFGLNQQELSLFVTELCQEFKVKFPGSDKFFGFYRNKLITELNEMIKTNMDDTGALEIIQSFDFSDQESLQLVQNILEIKFKKSNEEFLLKLLLIAVENLTRIKLASIPGEQFEKLGKLFISYLGQVEEIILNYLTAFPQNIVDLPVDFMENLLQSTAITKNTIRLACLLLENDKRLQEKYEEFILANLEKKEIVYPLINVAVQKRFLTEERSSKEFLAKIFGEFKSGIMKTVEKPQKVGVIYRENVLSSVALIGLCMPTNECVDFSGKAIKFSGVETYQMQIMMAIYFKAVKSVKDDTKLSTIFSSFINNYITLFNFHLKNPNLSLIEVTATVFMLERFLKLFEESTIEPDFTQLISSTNWSSYFKACLRRGMAEKSELSPFILRQLATICDWVYPSEAADIAHYFDSIFNHPEFFDVALKPAPTPLKEQLFRLILILAKRNGDVLQEKHLPLYFGAYQATIAPVDQFILALIALYESWDFKLPKPLLWGEAAILQYSLRDEPTQDLQARKTNAEILALLDEKTVLNSFRNFPIWRKLNPLEQIPVLEKSVDVDLSFRVQQQFVEQHEFKDEIELLEPPEILEQKRKNENVYDPAFIIPLVSMIFGPEQPDTMGIVVQKKLISVVFMALSSKDAEMRLAAANTLSRAKTELDGCKHFLGKELWVRVYETVQAGLGAIPQDKTHPVPRANTFATLFIGHTTNTLHNGLDDLFHVLSNYFVVKPIFDFSIVPEFFNLFFSPDIKYSRYRLFVLTLIKDGIKSIEDFLFLFKTPVLKAILACFSSPLSDTETDLMILEILKNMSRLPLAVDVLIVKFGILTWLHGVINKQETWYFDTICAIIEVLKNLWNAAQESRANYKNPEHIEAQLLALNLTLLPKLTVKIPVKSVEIFCEVLYKSCRGKLDKIPIDSLDAMQKYTEIVGGGDQYAFIREVASQSEVLLKQIATNCK